MEIAFPETARNESVRRSVSLVLPLVLPELIRAVRIDSTAILVSKETEAGVIGLLAVLLSCAGNVAPDLREAYCKAVYAWAPYRTEVREVRWCYPSECVGMGGAIFRVDTRTIAIDPQWPFHGDELLLTMEHEYGHALGLPHRLGNSIMKAGWDPPLASGPNADDFRDLKRMLFSNVTKDGPPRVFTLSRGPNF